MASDNKRLELDVITSGAFAAALIELLPIYEQKYPAKVNVSFGSSLGEAHDSIPTRLANGERFDLYFLARDSLDDLISRGIVNAADGVDLVESHIGAMVRVDDPAPDISTVAALKEALLASRSVAHAASASGIYISNVVFPELGIVEEMKKTARAILSERVGTVVARGDADLGFQQISEILPIEGVKVIGRLPEPYGESFKFCVGMGSQTDRIDEAKQLMRFVASKDAAQIIRDTGLDPLFPEIS